MSQDSNRCIYSLAWRGACGKPATEPHFCAEHAPVSCVSCGEKATGECCQTFTQFVCGAPLCDKCQDNGRGQHARKPEFETATFPDGPEGMPY